MLIERLDKKRHVRAGFDCGVESLNAWLLTKAGQYEREDLAQTYVLVDRDSPVVKGYYSLSSRSVVYDSLPQDQAKGLPSIDVPVVLIGRLAVAKGEQGKKFGQRLLLDALRRAETIADAIGVRAVEVDAIDDEAKAFYERYGFVSFVDRPRHSFMPMKKIRKLGLNL